MQKINNYRFTFIKKGDENNPDQVLGIVTVDDFNTNESFTLYAKAWRHASDICLLANKVKVDRV